jgi:hypothetical protein
MNIFRGKRGVLQKSLAKVREISIGIAGRGDALVHLNDVHLLPRHIFAGQVAQHDPGSVSATDSNDEAAASGNGKARFGGDEFGSFLSNGFRIRQDINLHGSHFPSLQSWRGG